MESQRQGRSRRWVGAVLCSWIRPATVSQGADDVPLYAAWFVHFVVVLLGVAVITFLVAWNQAPWDTTFGQIADTCSRWFYDLFDQPVRLRNLLIVFLIGLGLEVAMVVLAYLVMSWGARQEAFKASFLASLKRVWLGTLHIVILIAIVGSIVTLFFRASNQSWRTFNAATPTPTLMRPAMPGMMPSGMANRTQAQIEASNKAWKDYDKARQTYSNNRPWYVRKPDIVYLIALNMAAIWWLWALLRFVDGDRRVVPVEHEPCCETCGYNLTGTTQDRDCPECGLPVIESLGEDVRPGAPWQHRRRIGYLRALGTSLVTPIFHPTRFGKQLRVIERANGYRSFLLLVILGILILAPVEAWLLFFVTRIGRSGNWFALEDWLMFWWVITAGSTVAVIGLTLGGASLVGSLLRRHQRLNLLPGAIQGATYLGGYLWLWQMVFMALLVVNILASHNITLFEPIAKLLHMRSGSVAISLWSIVNGLMGGVYGLLLIRITLATRHANR